MFLYRYTFISMCTLISSFKSFRQIERGGRMDKIDRCKREINLDITKIQITLKTLL